MSRYAQIFYVWLVAKLLAHFLLNKVAKLQVVIIERLLTRIQHTVTLYFLFYKIYKNYYKILCPLILKYTI